MNNHELLTGEFVQKEAKYNLSAIRAEGLYSLAVVCGGAATINGVLNRSLAGVVTGLGIGGLFYTLGRVAEHKGRN